jgi:hypothetical protein
MEPAEVGTARQYFRAQALKFWEFVRDRDPKAANRNTDAADSLIQTWATEGVLVEVLHPLLTDEEPAVSHARAQECHSTEAGAGLDPNYRNQARPHGVQK